MRWVAEYERAWRVGDVAGVTRLFTDDARYRTSPYSDPKVGHAEIAAFWLDDEGRTFSVDAQPVAVEGRDAVVRLEVRYCLLYTSPSPRDCKTSRMPSSA